MSLRDALEAQREPRPKGPPCTFQVLLSDDGPLDAKDRAELAAALEDRDTYTHASIARALRDEGHHVGAQTVERHRRGDCRCVR